MKKRRYGVLLILGLSLLIVLIIVISTIATVSLVQTNSLFDKAYNESFAITTATEEANTDIISVYRAMKDVALSNSQSEIDKALVDVTKYDAYFLKQINFISSKNAEKTLVNDVINAYNDWKPIRQQTISYALQGDFEKAANNTKTKGSVQVAIIQAQMKILLDDEKKNSQNYFNTAIAKSKDSVNNLIIITIIAVLLGLVVSIYIRKKIADYETRLHFEKENLRITLHSIGDGVISTDMNRKVTMLNSIAEKLTGWNSNDALGKKFTQVFNIKSAETGNTAKDPVEEVILTDKICELENHTVLTSIDGTQRHIADSAAPIKDYMGKTNGVVMVFRDVTEKKISIERIKHLSFHDGLTGLYNRTYFESELERLNEPSQLPLSIISGDVNGLKLLNDVYGHKAGDELLKKIALILKQCCSEKDVVSRWGGDEFAIILPNTTNEQAINVCNNIQSACENTDYKPILLSISLGVSTKKSPSDDIYMVQKDAEDRMYTHKLVEGKGARSRIISSLQNTLYERSSETKEHAIRMSEIAAVFGKQLKLSQYEMVELKLLTMLHDVGKIGVPDNILNNQGILTLNEWYEMKKHPEIGYRIAQSTSELSHIAELILTHHERWDGTGYPQGLSGENIPKLSRILAIIDAFDAMTNYRTYKKTLSKKEAIEEIKRCVGTQFDPDFVDEFIKCQLPASENK
jgi:diguanylate cyclase (GGDEF)-like protein/PAS domain S-box-containing protein